MSAPKKPKVPVVLDALPDSLRGLQILAGDEMMAKAIEIARERLGLTPEKLALIILRTVAPEEMIEQGEEMILRGIGNPKTLKGYKDDGLLPRFINGVPR